MKHLQTRWSTGEGAVLAEEVVARLVSGRSLADLDLGEVNGKIDLRGLPAPNPRRLKRFEAEGWFVEQLGGLIKLDGLDLEGLDLSCSKLQSLRFHGCRIRGCIFDEARCQDWRLWATEVSDSTFISADLRGSAVGTWHDGRRNTWRRVDFSRSDFRVALSLEAVYEQCNFAHAKLAKVEFRQCAFSDCRFAGELADVIFDGRDLEKAPAPPPIKRGDFSEVMFRRVEFMGFDLKDIEMPRDPDVRLLSRARCVARHGLTLLDGDDRPDARKLRALFERRLRGPGTGDDTVLFNRRDYLEIGGPGFVALADEVITHAEKECLET